MRRRTWVFAGVIGLSCWAVPARAAIIPFDLVGKAGAGLLAGNENATINGTPGSGGEVGAGISFNDATSTLTLNFGFGAARGFTNLSGNATASHIHGPTASGGDAAYSLNAPVLIGIDNRAGWDPTATGGGWSGDIPLTATQASELLAGRYYVNVHTTANGGGEIRGNLVAVPEPASLGALALAGLTLAARRRRRRD